jgi:hypothetical protein
MADPPRVYANTVCPYCSGPLEPLPRAKKRCPACGQPIYVRSGPDGYVYLLREIDLPVLEAAWEEHRQAQDEARAAEMNREASRLTAEALRSYRGSGIRWVQLLSTDDCDLCGPMDRRTFRIEDASPVPLPGCPRARAGQVCPCDWVPMIGDALGP